MVRCFTLFAFTLYLCASASLVKAEEIWRFSQSPVATFIKEDGTGPFVDFIHEVAKEAGVKAEITVTPIRRAIRKLATGKADIYFGLALPRKVVIRKLLPARRSKFNINIVKFYIYSREKLDLKKLKDKNITASAGMEKFFDLKLIPSRCSDCMFVRVAKGKLHGVLAPPELAEYALRKHKLKLHKQFYQEHPVKALFNHNFSEEKEHRLARAFDRVVRRGGFAKYFPKNVHSEFMKNYNKQPSIK